jgi:hypothetical protein
VKQRRSVASGLAWVADILGGIFLGFYALLIGPLGVLRGPLLLDRLFWYAWVLLPLGVMTRGIRAIIDWRVGNFSVAIHQMEGILALVYDSYLKYHSPIKKRVLLDFYTLITRAYLHIGHVDKAMQMILQAQKNLNVEKLPDLYEIDAKTAHLIRAGIAAGRMLEGGGLATMFVKADVVPGQKPRVQPPPAPPSSSSPSSQQQPPKPSSKKTPPSSSTRGKLIPFPQR